MSQAVDELIPPPRVVRERLSQNIKERRRLRSLLRLSIQADEDRQAESRDRSRSVSTVPC